MGNSTAKTFSGPLAFLWAKTGSHESTSYHPLVLHLLDVAACVEAILKREPSTTVVARFVVSGSPALWFQK